MRDNINNFLSLMDIILPCDLKKHIIGLMCTENNMDIIQKQKQRKRTLNEAILKSCNTFYSDNNFILYQQKKNQLVVENIKHNPTHNMQIFHKSNNSIIPIQTHNTSNENQLIIQFDENIQHKPKIYILYM